MYLKKLRLQNIKCFEDVTLEFPHRGEDYSGWNVILGTNGRGKTTILRAAAVGGLSTVTAGAALQLAGDRLIRVSSGKPGRVNVDLVLDAAEQESSEIPAAGIRRSLRFPEPRSSEFDFRPVEEERNGSFDWPAMMLKCYGYGPFRRLESSSTIPPPLAFPLTGSRFSTLFLDQFGLPDAPKVLTESYIASIDEKHSDHKWAKARLESLIATVNSLLPNAVQIAEVTSEGVRFITPSAKTLLPRELSDGYRAFLALALDLLHHLANQLGQNFASAIRRTENGVAVEVEAVVLIDEADAHLHPSWQRELGMRLCRVFPKVQFIVTTHSPFVAQEATDDGLFVLNEGPDGTVTVDKPARSVRGWTASQILTSPLFGLESTRDPGTEETIRTATDLTAKEQERKLTTAEKKRLKTAREWLKERLSAPGETYEEMQRQQDMARYIDDTLSRLENGHP